MTKVVSAQHFLCYMSFKFECVSYDYVNPTCLPDSFRFVVNLISGPLILYHNLDNFDNNIS